MPVLFVVLCCTAVAALVFAEYSGRTQLKRIAKALASALFVAVALSRASGVSLGPFDATTALIVGLVVGAVGDLALLSKAEGAFLGGLGAFLLGHLAYAIAFARLSPIAEWLSVLAIPVVVSNAGVLAWLWPRLGSMRIPVVAYVGVICVMVIGAIGVWRTGAPAGTLIVVGSLLFAGSDVAVARERFVADTFVNKAWGLPAYYAGQLCIAWAVGVAS